MGIVYFLAGKTSYVNITPGIHYREPCAIGIQFKGDNSFQKWAGGGLQSKKVQGYAPRIF